MHLGISYGKKNRLSHRLSEGYKHEEGKGQSTASALSKGGVYQ
jgi:hypothetical protein